jgi:hypothetical protein
MSNANNSHRPGDGSTGPITSQGKQRSSRNATSHGARSEQHVILPNESAADYEKLRQHWYGEFPPLCKVDEQFLERLAQRDWHFQRCERLYNEAFMQAMLSNPDPSAWSPEQHKHLQLMHRYRATAERAWRAAWKDVETLRKNRFQTIRRAESLKRLLFYNLRDKINKPEPKRSEEASDGEERIADEDEWDDQEQDMLPRRC